MSVPKRQLHPGRMRNLVERTERGERGVHKEDQLNEKGEDQELDIEEYLGEKTKNTHGPVK